MPRSPSYPEPLSGTALLVGLIAYAVCLLLGFGFGWVAGARANRTPEVVQTEPPKPADTPKVEIKPAADNSLTDRAAKEARPPAEPPPKKDTPKAKPPKKKEEPPKAVAAKPPDPKPSVPKPEPPPKKEPPKTSPAPSAATNLTFAKDVLPVFRTYCNNCHSGPKPKGSVDLTSPAMIAKGKKGEPILKPGDPAASSVYVTVEDGTMPPEGKAPSDAEKKLIKDWIAGGAK